MIKTVTRKELKKLKARDFKENDIIEVADKFGDIIYTINISYGPYRIPMATTVNDKNYNVLSCTPGTKGGWPYYIADFIHS